MKYVVLFYICLRIFVFTNSGETEYSESVSVHSTSPSIIAGQNELCAGNGRSRGWCGAGGGCGNGDGALFFLSTILLCVGVMEVRGERSRTTRGRGKERGVTEIFLDPQTKRVSWWTKAKP
jgi:hypothetical protein